MQMFGLLESLDIATNRRIFGWDKTCVPNSFVNGFYTWCEDVDPPRVLDSGSDAEQPERSRTSPLLLHDAEEGRGYQQRQEAVAIVRG